MLMLTHDQKGLLEYLSTRVHELSIAATETAGARAEALRAEADELRTIRTQIVSRFEAADAALQMQLPLGTKQAA